VFGGLDFNQPLAAVSLEREHIVSEPITSRPGHMIDLRCKAFLAGGDQPCLLQSDHELLSSKPQRPILGFSLEIIDSSIQDLELIRALPRFSDALPIALTGRRRDEDSQKVVTLR
jgi:hypothetical protein